MNPNQIIERLRELQYLLFSIARFNVVSGFGVKGFEAKLRHATEAYTYIYKANLVSECLKYMYNQNDRKMAWDKKNININELVSPTGVNLNKVDGYILDYKGKISYLADLLHSCQSDNKLMYEPAVFLLHQLSFKWDDVVAKDSDIDTAMSVNADIAKTATGPKSELLDEIFEPTYSLLDRRSVSFGDNIDNNIEYFWNLSTRLCQAANQVRLKYMVWRGRTSEYSLTARRLCAKQSA